MMRITSVKTNKIEPQWNLKQVLDHFVGNMPEQSILVITSKIVALCEGAVLPLTMNKEDLVRQEADYYIPAKNKYNIILTIKTNVLIPSAGIDESNANGHYILWPRDAQQTANVVRAYIVDKFKLKKVGVIITDSKTTPLRWGTTGMAIAHSGFQALNNYIGRPDIFGRKLKMTKANVMDGLASAAVLVMGEGNEQTPLAIVEDIPFCHFQPRNPTRKELEALKIIFADDIYAPLLQAVDWQAGKRK